MGVYGVCAQDQPEYSPSSGSLGITAIVKNHELMLVYCSDKPKYSKSLGYLISDLEYTLGFFSNF